MKNALLATALAFHGVLAGQIVNVEAMRGSAEPDTTGGVHGRMDGGFYLGGTQALLLKMNGSVNMYRHLGDHVWYGIASANWATRLGNNQFDFERNGMMHVRYNRIYSEKLTAEYFVEWQSNLPMRIVRRFNAGGGPRYTAISGPGIKFFINPLLMYEYDVESFNGKTENSLRLNTYLSLDRQWDQWRWTTVAYYQPRFGRFEDVRAMANSRLSAPIRPDLSLIVVGQLNYDAYPAGTDVPNFTLYTTTGLSWKF